MTASGLPTTRSMGSGLRTSDTCESGRAHVRWPMRINKAGWVSVGAVMECIGAEI